MTPEKVDQLCALPALDDDAIIHELKEELPIYLVAASDPVIAEGETQLQCWKRQSGPSK